MEQSDCDQTRLPQFEITGFFFFSPGDEVQIDISSLVVEVCDVGKQNGFSSNFAHFLQRDSGADLENF